MIRKIAHLSDIHIMNDLDKQHRQQVAIESTITKLKEYKPDRIVIVGDLFHDFIKVNNEAMELAGYFLNQISNICQVIITQGNHDLNMKAINRIDSIKVVVDLLNNKNIHYLNRTMFYEDDNIVYGVYHHSEKTSPYDIYPDFKTTKTIIDLYHNPISGCVNYMGEKFEGSKYYNLSDFKGNLLFLGDIHQYQEFYDKKENIKGIYPSSLYQNHFGESVNKHGFVLWDIIDKTFEHIEVYSDYSYINIYLSDVVDYNDIDIIIDSTQLKKYTEVKIHWYDKESEINNHNWRLIQNHIKSRYNITKIRKSTNKNKVYNNVTVQNSVHNITNNTVQHTYFKEYLSSKGYYDAIINAVINIDNIISERLSYDEYKERKDWRLHSFYIDNYRSHGDRFDISWDNQYGIYQIMGKNAVGKTNMLSAIMYLFYGKTLETLKKETCGDNRFINNKRDLDYCEVGGVLNVDEQYYSIVRRTERKWDRNKSSIKSTPTTFTINMVDYNGNLINETDEQKSKTQKKIESILGDFEDFMSLYLVNADTLNVLLSVDESKFMDTILSYSGLDIFAKKLEEYKDYKKEQSKKTERINLDIDTELEKIKYYNNNIQQKEQDIVIISEKIVKAKERIEKGNRLNEEEIKKLYRIDDSLISMSIEQVDIEIETLKSKKVQILNKEQEIKNEILLLKECYDEQSYNNIIQQKDDIVQQKNKYCNNINKLNIDIKGYNDNIVLLKSKIYYSEKQHSIEQYNIDAEILNIKDRISFNNKEIDLIIKNIDNQINNIQNEISILESSKTCPSCGQELKKENIIVIQDKIKDKLQQIKDLESSKLSNTSITKINEDIKVYQSQVENVKNDIIDGIRYKMEEHSNNILLYKKNIEDIEQDIIKYQNDIETIKQNIKNIDIDIDNNTIKYNNILLEKQDYDKRVKLCTQLESIPVYMENYNLKIENNITIKKNILNERVKKEHNDAIHLNIDKYTTALKSLNDEYITLNDNMNIIKNDIQKLKENIIFVESRIEQYKKQEYEDNINKIYVDCIHRDGLPKVLLLRMREEINNQIESLIGDICNFNLYFDENMTLKMYTCDNNTAIQNVIGGSGMERTFISLVLRLALREINNTSLGNFIFLDEITGKLVGESVQNFFELLHKIKEKIEKVVIIEHAYSDDLQCDYSIEVVADERGVSQIIM